MRGVFHSHAWLDNVLSDEEMMCIVEERSDHWIVPPFGGDGKHKPVHKPCTYRKIMRPEFNWVYSRIIDAVDHLNREYLHVDWDCWVEEIQLSRYRDKAEHCWHIDWGKGDFYYRKLNISVALDDDYSGGGLQLFVDDKPTTIELVPGRIVVFSTQFLHRVTPVTNGTRTVLVTWGHGPCWR